MRIDSEAMAFALLVAAAGCVEERIVSPRGDLPVDAGAPDDDSDAATGPFADAGDGGGEPSACDLSGRWIVAQVVRAEALGATQKTVNWFFHDIEQDGDGFTIVRSLNCGLRVTGTTTVTISDATTEALARKTSFSNGRKGTFAPTPDGKCKLDLDRTYNLRGALLGPFLTDHWVVGDPPVALTTFPALPKNAAEGMEDWDADGKEGITLNTGLGDRYVAQRDWSEDHGVVPAGVDSFGGSGVVVVTWDGQEAVSAQTPLLLQTQATPINPGHSWWKRVGAELVVVETGARPELETCKNVQRLALEAFPNP